MVGSCQLVEVPGASCGGVLQVFVCPRLLANIEAMSKSHHTDFTEAVAAKRRLTTLDGVLTDNQLDRHLWKWGGKKVAESPVSKLTLGTALLVRPDIAAAIDHQLKVLSPLVYQGRVPNLVKQLLNDTEGLLNTWSELGLAMRLLEDGWSVEIGRVFHGNKDVDVRAERDGDVRFVDVINFAPVPIEDTMHGFQSMPGSTPLEPKLKDKVQEKVGTKFAKARAAGWIGSAWVAVDYSKYHGLDIDLQFRQLFTGEDWRDKLAAELATTAAGLDGVIYYSFGAVNYVQATQVTWTPIPGIATTG